MNMPIRSTNVRRQVNSIIAPSALMVAGMLVATVSRNMKKSGTTIMVGHVGEAVVGLAFAACMLVLVRINGTTSGMTLDQRIPVWMVRVAAGIGFVTGIAIALREFVHA